MSYPVPRDETERLAKLHETGVLYTEPTENFDRLTQLAAHLFEVPMALVSFVDKEEQWFKSKIGVDVCSTSREAAFCAHTILGDEVLVIKDARSDPRFKENPLVRGSPFIRFYAGAPIVIGSRVRVGTICVLDQRPRDLSPTQRLLLTYIAQSCATELRLVLAFKKIRELVGKATV